MSAVLKSAGFVFSYLACNLVIHVLFPGYDTVTAMIVTDAAMVLAGLLYCFQFVFPHDCVVRENSGGVRIGRMVPLFVEFGAIWLLTQMTGTFLQSMFYDASYASYQDTLSGAGVFEILVMTVVLAPAAEEILMRGMVQTCLRDRFGPLAGVLAASFVFAALHGTWVHLYAGMVLGIALGLIYERTRALPVCIAAHMLCNAMSILLSGVSFSTASWTGAMLLGLNVWMAARFCAALHDLQREYKSSRAMAYDDFEESCFGDKNRNG